jgi:hypothetical protein
VDDPGGEEEGDRDITKGEEEEEEKAARRGRERKEERMFLKIKW